MANFFLKKGAVHGHIGFSLMLAFLSSRCIYLSMKVYFFRSYLVMWFKSFEFFKILGSWDMDGSSYPCC